MSEELSSANFYQPAIDYFIDHFDTFYRFMIKPFFAGAFATIGNFVVRKMVYLTMYYYPWSKQNSRAIEEMTPIRKKESDDDDL